MAIELTPTLREAWLRNGIASRYFVDRDTCEEIVRGLPDIVFVLTRTGETTWVLSGIKESRPVKADSQPKTLSKRQQRYEQYQ